MFCLEKGTGRILGFHIIGSDDPLLIQEVVTVMAGEGSIDDIKEGLHIFPSLSELVTETIGNLKEGGVYAAA